MIRTRLRPGLVALAACLLFAADARAVGISVDAGLTPADGRWIFRTQVRSMSRTAPEGTGSRHMDRLVVPVVAVHGLRPQLTLGVRQTWDDRTMTMMGNETGASGLGDLYVFAKYKALRVNTRTYTFGIAPLVGLEAPTGAAAVSSGFWSLRTGLLFSGRMGTWGADLNLAYGFQGFAGVDGDQPRPGDLIDLNLALARQIPLGSSGRTALAPVLEITWQDRGADSADGVDLADSGESIFSLAPGLKFTRGDLIVEGLVRIPVAQDQTGPQLEMGNMYLLGVRRMF